METPLEPSPPAPRTLVQAAGWFALVLQLYVFLVGIETLSGGFKSLGKETAEALFSGLENPIAGLAVGILATVLVQSSSVTTSIVVALVGASTLSVAHAIPIVMGANIGTSITNTLVSLGHVTQRAEFRRAFAGATVHDFFNLLNVALLLPVELITRKLCGVGVLEWIASWLARHIVSGEVDLSGAHFKSPLKTAVKWAAGYLESGLEATGLQGSWLAAAMLVAALALIIISLVTITRNMRTLMADRIEVWMNRVLKKSGLLGILIGAVVTVLVQSSSITTSLLVPMFGAGILRLEAGFPVVLGTNIGTTVTAVIASSVAANPQLGLTIALVHTLFNVVGTGVFYPIRRIRRIPIRLAQRLAKLAAERWHYAVLYVVGVFIVLPLVAILVFR